MRWLKVELEHAGRERAHRWVCHELFASPWSHRGVADGMAAGQSAALQFCHPTLLDLFLEVVDIVLREHYPNAPAQLLLRAGVPVEHQRVFDKVDPPVRVLLQPLI